MLSLYLYVLQETYEEILREKIVSQSDIDQSEAYYQVAGEKRREEYTVLDLKQKITTSISFVLHHLYNLQFLNQHQ